MRLYYYTPLIYGLTAIRDQRLKISQFSNLNDPADNVGLFVIRRDETEALKVQREVFNAQGGIICMSADWQNTLMWGHYADNHRGVCLVFDCNEALWQPVEYQNERRPTPKTFGKNSYREMDEADFRKLALMKSNQWIYENEYRRFEPFDYYDFVHNIYYCPFDNDMKLVGVLFGMRCAITDKQIDEILKRSDIKMAFVGPQEFAYRMSIDGSKKRRIRSLSRRLQRNIKTKHVE